MSTTCFKIPFALVSGAESQGGETLRGSRGYFLARWWHWGIKLGSESFKCSSTTPSLIVHIVPKGHLFNPALLAVSAPTITPQLVALSCRDAVVITNYELRFFPMVRPVFVL